MTELLPLTLQRNFFHMLYCIRNWREGNLKTWTLSNRYSQVIKGWNHNSDSTYGYAFSPLSLDCGNNRMPDMPSHPYEIKLVFLIIPHHKIGRQTLYCPAVFGHFLDPPSKIIPVGQIFRRLIKSINQSINQEWQQMPTTMVKALRSRSLRLIDWLTISDLWLDWFIGFVLHDLFLRGRG